MLASKNQLEKNTSFSRSNKIWHMTHNIHFINIQLYIECRYVLINYLNQSGWNSFSLYIREFSRGIQENCINNLGLCVRSLDIGTNFKFSYSQKGSIPKQILRSYLDFREKSSLRYVLWNEFSVLTWSKGIFPWQRRVKLTRESIQYCIQFEETGRSSVGRQRKKGWKKNMVKKTEACVKIYIISTSG